MLPLMSLVSINVMMSLLEILIIEESTANGNDEEEKEATPDNNTDTSAPATPVNNEGNKKMKESSYNEKVEKLSKECFNSRGLSLIPILLKVIKKLVSYSHMYVCRGGLHSSQDINEDIQDVINHLLSVSSTTLVSTKTTDEPAFYSQIPEFIQNLIKRWNSTIVLEGVVLERIQSGGFDKVGLFEELWMLVSIALSSFAVQQTFEPCCALKSVLYFSISLLYSLFYLDQKSCQEFLPDVTPLFVDSLTKFAAIEGDIKSKERMGKPLAHIFNIFDKTSSRRACITLKVLIHFMSQSYIYIALLN